MAVYKLFPLKDTTLYSQYPNQNTGLDEILEVSVANTSGTGTALASRALIQFSTDEIAELFTTKISSSVWDATLKCSIANVTGLNGDTSLEIYPISQPWEMGIGKQLYIPEVTTGASWNYTDYDGGTPWITPGGDWDTTYSANQLFLYYSNKDLNVNVTDIMTAWSSSLIPNYGFIIKQQTEFSPSPIYNTNLKYFSRDTNTIYPPYLEFKWVDTSFNTGSSPLTELTSTPSIISLDENPGVFYPSSINRFRVNCRPEYPERIFTTSSLYTQNYFLPTSSYYSIKDLDTNETIVDFDNIYTQLSVDQSGSYFDLYMSGLEPERYYSILIKTILDNSTLVFNNNYYFKVING